MVEILRATDLYDGGVDPNEQAEWRRLDEQDRGEQDRLYAEFMQKAERTRLISPESINLVHRMKPGRMYNRSVVDQIAAQEVRKQIKATLHVVKNDPEPTFVEMEAVQIESVDWLWAPYLPLGKLVILDGDPGLGKSTVMLDLAARITTGNAMPDGSSPWHRIGDGAGVVIYSAEDGLGDTVRPRLEAAGADLCRIAALNGSPTIPNDIPVMEAVIVHKQARLLILDPLMAMFSSGIHAHVDQEVRQALHPLMLLAERTGCTIVMIRHLNKVQGNAAVYRGGGSIGIIGAVRSGLVVAKSPDDPDNVRVFSHSKASLARQGDSLAYSIEDAHGVGRVVWKGRSNFSADELVNQDVTEAPEREEAATFLREVLADGRLPAEDVKKAARQAGITEGTLKRAKSSLGVEAAKEGFGVTGRWYWALTKEAAVTPRTNL